VAIKARRLDSDNGGFKRQRREAQKREAGRARELVKEEEEEQKRGREKKRGIGGTYGRRHAVGYIGFVFPSTTLDTPSVHTDIYKRVRAQYYEAQREGTG